jgi:hypothetical protein
MYTSGSTPLAYQLKADVPRMRQLLRNGAEFNAAATRELSQISRSLRDAATSSGRDVVAQIADRLIVKLKEMALPSRHVSVVEELALWHLFVKLKSAAAQEH